MLNLPMFLAKPKRFEYQNVARAVWIPHPSRKVDLFIYIHTPLAIRTYRKTPVLIWQHSVIIPQNQ